MRETKKPKIPAFAAMTWHFAAWSTLSVALALPAHADVPMAGTLVASTACPALQSIKKNTDPGSITLTPGQSYTIVSANNTPASHYMVIVPGANPERRWVAINCGAVQGQTGAASTAPAQTARASLAPAPTPLTAAKPSGSVAPTHFVLSISWEPGFCAGHDSKTECAAETPTSFDATHFTLHGLWPDPREYCGVASADIAADKAGHWDALPAVDLTDATRAHLSEAMPGTQSLLERHEWLKHGTCTGATADAYFGRALTFLDAVNASPIRMLVAGNVGRDVSLNDLRSAFDQAFGKGAGQRIRLSCPRQNGERLITEITVGLEGDVMGSADLPTLIAAASPTNGGCDRGTVAAAAGGQ